MYMYTEEKLETKVVNPGRTDNTIAKRKRTSEQTTIELILVISMTKFANS